MKTETYHLADEVDRINAERQELAETVAQLEDGNPLIQRKARRGKELDRQRKGLLWALNEDAAGDERGREAYETVTLSELTAGTRHRADAYAESDTVDLDVPNGASIKRLYRVASAVEDADFLDGGNDFGDVLIAVSELNPFFFDWLDGRVSELSTPEVEGNGFAQLVADAAAETEGE